VNAIALSNTLFTEEYLIQSARQGDLEAYNNLVIRYQERAYRLACSILWDEDAAEDATQMAFLRAYQRLHTYRGGCFKMWLLKIVTNICTDELRRRNRHPLLFLERSAPQGEDCTLEDTLQSSSPGPEQVLVQRELERTVRQSLERLPFEFRMVLVLVDMQEMDYRQAARLIGCPVGTVKSRLARARLRLREMLGYIGAEN
jgi:RNA polymerase sigma-70 factor (ECF subfamily)